VSGEGLSFTYIEAPPTKWTFEPDSVRRFVESQLEGRVLNLFAGETKLRHSGEIVRNDLDEKREADVHIDATQCRKHFEDCSFNTVVLDPPYNVRKAREKYEGEYMGAFKRVKNQVQHLVEPGGRVITFGYDSTGMSKSRGYEKEHISLLNHKGDHNDTICTIERRVNRSLSDY